MHMGIPAFEQFRDSAFFTRAAVFGPVGTFGAMKRQTCD